MVSHVRESTAATINYSSQRVRRGGGAEYGVVPALHHCPARHTCSICARATASRLELHCAG